MRQHGGQQAPQGKASAIPLPSVPQLQPLSLSPQPEAPIISFQERAPEFFFLLLTVHFLLGTGALTPTGMELMLQWRRQSVK